MPSYRNWGSGHLLRSMSSVAPPPFATVSSDHNIGLPGDLVMAGGGRGGVGGGGGARCASTRVIPLSWFQSVFMPVRRCPPPSLMKIRRGSNSARLRWRRSFRETGAGHDAGMEDVLSDHWSPMSRRRKTSGRHTWAMALAPPKF